MVDVTVEVPLALPQEAVMIAVPAATAVTSPEADTVATPVLFEDQVIVRPVKILPFASRATAVSCTVDPTCTLGALGEIVTLATGTGGGTLTVRVALPV